MTPFQRQHTQWISLCIRKLQRGLRVAHRQGMEGLYVPTSIRKIRELKDELEANEEAKRKT